MTDIMDVSFEDGETRVYIHNWKPIAVHWVKKGSIGFGIFDTPYAYLGVDGEFRKPIYQLVSGSYNPRTRSYGPQSVVMVGSAYDHIQNGVNIPEEIKSALLARMKEVKEGYGLE